jgi:hypothetical protein
VSGQRPDSTTSTMSRTADAPGRGGGPLLRHVRAWGMGISNVCVSFRYPRGAAWSGGGLRVRWELAAKRCDMPWASLPESQTHHVAYLDRSAIIVALLATSRCMTAIN